MASEVQTWLDTPALNHGWILVGDETRSTTARRFSSREGSVPPALLIDFDDYLLGTTESPDVESDEAPVDEASTDWQFVDELLIDDFIVRASSGPLRDDSVEKREIDELGARQGYEVVSLRREQVVDSGFLLPLVFVYVIAGMGAIWFAFGAVWRPRRDAEADDEADAEPPDVVAPEV